MSRFGSEAALRGRVRDGLRTVDRRAHVVQVENGECGPGTPDTYACIQGVAVWLELKFVPAPVRPSTPIRCAHVRMSQVKWIADEVAAGGRAWFLVQVGATLHLVDGPLALMLRNTGVPREALAARAAYSSATPCWRDLWMKATGGER